MKLPELDPDVARALAGKRDVVRKLTPENAESLGRFALGRPKTRECWVHLAALSIAMLERYPAEPIPPDVGPIEPPVEPTPAEMPADQPIAARAPELDFTGALAGTTRPAARLPYAED